MNQQEPGTAPEIFTFPITHASSRRTGKVLLYMFEPQLYSAVPSTFAEHS